MNFDEQAAIPLPVPSGGAIFFHPLTIHGSRVNHTDGIRWSGVVPANGTVTLDFRVTVSRAVTIKNTAVVSDGYGMVLNLVAFVNAERVYLPLVLRGYGP